MKNETSQPLETLRAKPIPLIKLLSLATVALGVLYHGWLDMLAGAWLVWLVLALLLLLDAGGAETQPAAWSQWTAVLGRIFSPAILPYYGALCLLLAVGPSYVNKTPVFSLPTKGNGLSNRLDETPGLRAAQRPGTLNAPSFPSSPQRPTSPFNKTQRPNGPPASSTLVSSPSPAKPSSIPPEAGSFSPTPSTPKPASALPTSGPPKVFKRPEIIQPSSSARPAPTTPK